MFCLKHVINTCLFGRQSYREGIFYPVDLSQVATVDGGVPDKPDHPSWSPTWVAWAWRIRLSVLRSQEHKHEAGLGAGHPHLHLELLLGEAGCQVNPVCHHGHPEKLPIGKDLFGFLSLLFSE